MDDVLLGIAIGVGLCAVVGIVRPIVRVIRMRIESRRWERRVMQQRFSAALRGRFE